MLKSMTGFAKVDVSSKVANLSLEISSVNKRFLDVNILLPKTFLGLEGDIRKKIAGNLVRGQVLIKFDLIPNDKNIFSFLPNISYLKNLKKGWQKLSKDLGYKNELSLEFLLDQTKYLPEENVKDIKPYKTLFLLAIDKALKSLVVMRKKEGKTIAIDIEKRVLKIKKELLKIEKKAPITKKEFEQKLNNKFEKIFEKDFEERLLKEVLVFSEKVDITEEIVRLKSHIKQFLELLNAKSTSHGRKLEFLLQEFLRETNTIASKAQNSFITKAIVEIKDEIEKIKEQLQNVE